MKNRKVVAVILGILGLVAAGYSLFASSASEERRKLLLIAWSILPPVFFWLEDHYVCRKIPKEQMEDFRMFQELSRNVWVGIATALAVAYIKP